MVGGNACAPGERRAWLRLARTDGIGPATFRHLLIRFGSAANALEAVPHLARRGGRPDVLRIPSDADAAKEIDALQALGGMLLCGADAEFPAALAALDPPPPILSVLGRTELLRRDSVAIVGARNASALGIKFARNMAHDLGRADLVVTSGLARGIDAAAHAGALSSGTIAVVAGGVDIVYPPENKTLYDQLRLQGAVVSEMPLGVSPQSRHFPRRNRLISGLSRGVVVVEAAERSGSLITASYALEQGREIFAVPGSPLDPRARGANRLIRDGATLTESAEDVLAVLRPMLARNFQESEDGYAPVPADVPALTETDETALRARVEEKLGPSGVEIDELVRQCGAPAALVLTVLLELELAGRVERQSGNRVAARP